MLEITWLGHGTFQFRLDTGEVFLIDPWLGNPAYPKAATLSRLDALLLTHGHFDHIHSALDLAKKFSPQVVGIFELCRWLESKGVKNLNPMNKGGSQKVGPVTVTMTHAVHSGGIEDDGKLIYGGEAAGYVLRFPDERALYFAGDTNVFSDMQLIQRLYRPELVFLPIGNQFTMSPREAALACELLKPRQVIPMHLGTFPALTGRPEELEELVREMPEIEVWALEPGKSVQW